MIATKQRDWFSILNPIFLVAAAILCLLPFIHVLAISLSKSTIAMAGEVSFWPKGFNLISYKVVLRRQEFWRAMVVSLERLLLAVPSNMALTILAAYPLSKSVRNFRSRTVYVWIIFFTMLFTGGLIPTYVLIQQLGMLDSIWALVLPPPFGVPVFNVLILLNFFRNIPTELEEAAFMDGASHWTILGRIYIPTSMAALATLTLFVAVRHWNSWFDGMIFMNTPEHYPMQTFLRSIVILPDTSMRKSLTIAEVQELAHISERTVKSAQIFIGALPILVVYPYLQRYFVKGMVLGSLKG